MNRRTIVLNNSGNQPAAAVLADGQLEDFLFSTGCSEFEPGAILNAVIGRPLQRQGLTVVRLSGKSNAMLKSRIAYRQGAHIPVQISAYAEPGKILPVTDRFELRGRYSLLSSARTGISISRKIRAPEFRAQLTEIGKDIPAAREYGVIFRSSASIAGNSELRDEINHLSECAGRVNAAKDSTKPGLIVPAPSPLDRAVAAWGGEAFDIDDGSDAFDRHGIHDLLDPFRQSEWVLPNGGNLAIETFRAMTAIDVNTGSDLSPSAALKTNIQAARALSRQLRIRGLGGQIVVDFAPMRKADRPLPEKELAKAFAEDRISTTLVGWTGLGHFELNRHRDRLPLTHWEGH